jgi:hypothetical protein
MEVDAGMVDEDGEEEQQQQQQQQQQQEQELEQKQEQEDNHEAEAEAEAEAEESAADMTSSPSPLPSQQIHHAIQQQGEQGASGPRPAPTFKATSAICEEDGPGPRCGHTLTAVAAVGEEGTAGYVGPRLILFGGATALEGNSSVAAAQTISPGAGIRMFHSSIKFEGHSVVSNRSLWSSSIQ